MTEPQQRQQFGNALEKYSMLFSVVTTSYYVRMFQVWSTRYSLFSWLFAYVVMQLLLGIPMFLMEYFIGQFSSSSIITMYSVTPALKGTGITCLFLVLLWLYVVMHDTGKELVTLAYTFTMPWTNCGNSWNTDNCQMEKGHSESNSTYEDIYDIYEDTKDLESPYEEFVKYVLHGKDIAFVWYVMLAIIIILPLVYFLAINGTRMTGKVAFGSIVFRIGTIVVLLLVGLVTTLSNGGVEGLKMYFYPDFWRLQSVHLWLDATRSVFYIMGSGFLTTLGSYDKINNNCLLDAIVVAGFNAGYSVLYGIATALYAGYIAQERGKDIASLHPDEAWLWPLSTVPGHFLWVFLYVLMNLTAKIAQCVIALELVLTSLSDAYPKHFGNRRMVALGLCVPLILFSIIFSIGYEHGYVAWNFVDYYFLGRGLLGNISWFIFIFVFLYGAGRLVRDMRHFLPRISWAVTWPCYLSWIVILHLVYAGESNRMFQGELYFLSYKIPSWVAPFMDFMVSVVLWFTIIYAIVYLIKAKGTFVQRLKTGLLPSADFGPKDLPAKQSWVDESKKHHNCCMCCGCLHPDCCGTQNSGAVYDAAIPIRVEMTNNPGQPSSYPNAPLPVYDYKPLTVKPEGTTAEAGLYPKMPDSS